MLNSEYTDHYIEEKTMFLHDISHKLLENKIEALRLNIERRALKQQHNKLLKYPILTLYAIMAEKQLEDNLKLMNLIAREQKLLKEQHAKYSSSICKAINNGKR